VDLKVNEKVIKMDLKDIYDELKNEFEITDNNVRDYRYVMSHRDQYSEIVREQSRIVIESIRLGQSMMSMGQLMSELYNATHKQDCFGTIHELPGRVYFLEAAKVAGEAIETIKSINEVAEQFAQTQVSCNETCDMSYV